MAVNPLSIPRLPNAITTPGTQPNFQTLSGQNTYVPPPSSTTLQQLASLGQKAKSPEQNVKTVAPALPTSQVSTYKPPIANSNTQSPLTSNVNPNAGQFGTGGIGGPSQSVAAQPPQNTGLYGQLIGQLSTQNPFNNTAVSDAYKKAQDIQSQLEQSRANQANSEAENRLNPIPIGDQTGREAVIRSQYLAQQNALAQQGAAQSTLYQAGLTGTGQQLQGLTSAAGLVQPQQVSYNNQLINPVTGGTYGQYGQGGTLNDAVSNAVQRIQNGTGYNDALATLNAYGQAGVNALNQALGPSFNITQSNANAAAQGQSLGQTTTQAQATQKAVDYANTVLDNLTHAYQGLGSAQTTGIPGVNALANLGSQITGLGIGGTQSFNNQLQEARAAISSALVASGTVTPTNAGGLALSMIPDNATPTQIASAKAALKELLGQRAGIYTAPYQAPQYGQGASGNSIYSF